MLAGSTAAVRWGAHIRDRTGDLSLTKTVLYLLSYVGVRPTLPECNRLARAAGQALPLGSPRVAALPEPVKGLEPITGGLQNRCSTVELHRQPYQYRPARSRRSMPLAVGCRRTQSSMLATFRCVERLGAQRCQTDCVNAMPTLRTHIKRNDCNGH